MLFYRLLPKSDFIWSTQNNLRWFFYNLVTDSILRHCLRCINLAFLLIFLMNMLRNLLNSWRCMVLITVILLFSQYMMSLHICCSKTFKVATSSTMIWWKLFNTLSDTQLNSYSGLWAHHTWRVFLFWDYLFTIFRCSYWCNFQIIRLCFGNASTDTSFLLYTAHLIISFRTSFCELKKKHIPTLDCVRF